MTVIVNLKPGYLVQLSPDCANQAFACCVMVVDEVKSWGIVGYVATLGDKFKPASRAVYCAPWHELAFVGVAKWLIKDEAWKDLGLEEHEGLT